MLRSRHVHMKIPWLGFLARMLLIRGRGGLMALGLILLLFLPYGRLQKLLPASPQDMASSSSMFNETAYRALSAQCPQIVPRLFVDHVPRGKYDLNNAMKMVKIKPDTADPMECVHQCCQDPGCMMIFMFKNLTELNCYKSYCENEQDCLPSHPDDTQMHKVKGKASMVLVRTASASSWADIDPSLSSDLMYSDRAASDDPDAGSKEGQSKACQMGRQDRDCAENEECVAVRDQSLCQCKQGFVRKTSDSAGCVAVTPTLVPVPQKIVVSVVSKEIQLPINSVKLAAFAVPEAVQSSYNYEWKLVNGPAKGNMENSHTQTLKLSELVQGTYQFKVIVSGGNPPGFGEALGNVTVLPARRVNLPPKAVVQPAVQVVNLPTATAIIDGSGSTDDTMNMSYKWEIVNGPLNYQAELPGQAMLTLSNLVAGNYTISLTVTDSDGVSDSATAHLIVEEEKDYPPTANAGEDIIIYLPNNEVDLHGNVSTDDHGIVAWEWTRASNPQGGRELPADTKNMRTPHAHLSNLEEGVYTFILKVTDAKGQSNEDQVNVYVKPPISLPPKANAGPDQEISLPVTWVVLDGSGSKDDIHITEYLWTQVSGPNDAVILNANASLANATQLTKGKYVFKLQVKDNLKNAAESTVQVMVNQDSNSPPVAKAGNDVVVTMPKSVVVLNGSASHDDLKIVRYEWTRLPNSLAAGKVVGNTSSEAVLLLVNLVPGLYSFQLKVWDEQGKYAQDTVSIKVKPNPEEYNVIEAVLDVKLTALTQSRLDAFGQSMGLLVRNDGSAKMKVLNLLPQQNTGFATLTFLMQEEKANGSRVVIPGVEVLSGLETKLKASQDILDLKVLQIDTVICQNTCSGHGQCDEATRTCVCEPFWIENTIRKYLMDGKSNCDWSIIYVGIVMSIVGAGIICSSGYVLCKKKKKRCKPKRRYTRLDQVDNSHVIELRNAQSSSLMTSETDSDDEVLFSDDWPNRRRAPAAKGPALRSPGPNGAMKRNGYAKFDQDTSA